MRHSISLAVILGLLTGGLSAQDATLTSPLTHASETKFKVRSFFVNNPPVGAASASIEISSQDSGNNEITTLRYSIPGCGTATVTGLVTAMMTVRATETGSDVRKMQFRVIGYLNDQGCLPAATLNP